MVAFLYHVPEEPVREADRLTAQVHANFEDERTIARLVDHVRAHGTELTPVNAARDDWPARVTDRRVFNYTYGFGLLADSVRPTLVLEAAGADYVGAPPAGLYLSANKPHASDLMGAAGFDVPRQRLVCDPVGITESAALCAWFGGCDHVVVKPAYEESSVGLAVAPVEPEGLRAVLADLFDLLPGPFVVQEYVEGVDVTVPVIGRTAPHCLPAVGLVLERPADGPFVFDAARKATKADVHYAPLTEWSDDVLDAVYAMALRAFRITGQRDYARLDCRVTPTGRCYFLEVNANPQLGLGKASFAVSANAAGLEVGEVIGAIIRDQPAAPGLPGAVR
ncbi:hypothetical protein LZG04_10490 [Saccharothrix sp. S26]|uniref:hypothetical protein n=1 Tax=Saccharothrix sp. S26 TaxID=2907215 RepID=UPI001F344326|nr:hypothetical protein [Saccharothrix sp. S26]MCE6995235.1 hypothetical protein [Saccharothrix sp. S26]